MSDYGKHIPVLLEETLGALIESSINFDGPRYYADLTFGGGGHSLALLARDPNSIILAVDQDEDAIENAEKLIKERSLQDRLIIKLSLPIG